MAAVIVSSGRNSRSVHNNIGDKRFIAMVVEDRIDVGGTDWV